MLTDGKEKNENRKLASMPNLARYTFKHYSHQQLPELNCYETFSRFYIRLQYFHLHTNVKQIFRKEKIKSEKKNYFETEAYIYFKLSHTDTPTRHLWEREINRSKYDGGGGWVRDSSENYCSIGFIFRDDIFATENHSYSQKLELNLKLSFIVVEISNEWECKHVIFDWLWGRFSDKTIYIRPGKKNK